jgi:hypothetical protein
VSAPADFKLTPIRAGQPYTRSVEGGFRRAKAPSDGLIVELEDRAVFVPLAELMAAIAQASPRAAPRRATLPFGVLPGGDPEAR